MKPLRFLHKPEYFFKPAQAFRRAAAFFRPEQHELRIKTPWQDQLSVNERETIGRSLSHMGVYDLVLTECLWRLTKDGDSALDVGANLGYFSSLLATKVGKKMGGVKSFEPHPRLFQKLQDNLKTHANVQLYNLALSETKGVLELFIPSDFSGNEGTATLEVQTLKKGAGSAITVNVNTLDAIVGDQPVDVLKIDVEGHELAVFKGATQVLKNTRHILFEDFHGAKSQAIVFLQAAGFEVFRLKKGFWGPQLVSIAAGEGIPLWEPPNYIATREVANVRAQLAPRGWRCLL